MIDILIIVIKIPNDKNVWLNKMSQTSDNFSKWHHTSYNSFYKWTKISSLEIIIFELKNDGKKWSRIYFEIHLAPSEICTC